MLPVDFSLQICAASLAGAPQHVLQQSMFRLLAVLEHSSFELCAYPEMCGSTVLCLRSRVDLFSLVFSKVGENGSTSKCISLGDLVDAGLV
jgi:hypothetical protein